MQKKVYFISDIHLGLYPYEESARREKILVNWLDDIKTDASHLFLVGDIFDYWYEFRKVVPRGFVRFLGKLAELSDSGIEIHFFTGNHDVWVFDYLPSEIGLTLHRHPFLTNILGKEFYIAHGDGLGPGDKSYLILKWAFTNKILQWLFSRIHPNFSVKLGHAWSKKSRFSKGIYADFKGKDKEWLILYAEEEIKRKNYFAFIFGHRHIPMDLTLSNGSKFICLGDWIISFTYATFDGNKLELKRYIKKANQPEIIKDKKRDH